MKLGLVSMGYLPYVRRRMRKSGLRLTVRWGKVYTVAAVETTQPETEAQLRARDVLARASEAAKREMGDPERRLYWTMHAAEMGYKTARGACVAHHVRRLKEEEAAQQRRSMEALKAWAEEARVRRERRRREMEEEMNRPVSEEVMRRILAAEARLRERLRQAERYEYRRRRRTGVYE